jgi:hypothetical protein
MLPRTGVIGSGEAFKNRSLKALRIFSSTSLSSSGRNTQTLLFSEK